MTVVDSRADPSQRARIRDNAPHSHYALERDDIHMELEAFRRVCEFIGVQKQWRVLEPFCGSGWHSALIQKLVQPVGHLANDIAGDCAESTRRTLPGAGVKVVQGDGYEMLSKAWRGKWQWVHADYNLWTLRRMADDPTLRAAWLGMFDKATDCVTFTDTTIYTLRQSNNSVYPWYSEVSEWIPAMTGWRIQHIFNWGPAAMYLLKPEDKIRGRRDITEITEPMDVTILGVEEA